jgi:hypothetical protein
MYKLINKPYTNELFCIKRLTDNAFIPNDPDNTDYAAYLKWLEAGNTPQPADEVTK